MDTRIALPLEDRWESPEDFLYGLTEEVWDQRRVDALLEHSSDALIHRGPEAVLRGNGRLAAAILGQMAEFPGLEHLTEDVIWCQTAALEGAGQRGFLGAQRMIAQGHHGGSGVFGSASGKPVSFRTMAEYWCTDSAICDAWVITDRAAVLRQLGEDPRAWVQAKLEESDRQAALPPPLTPDTDVDGPYSGTGSSNDTADQVAGYLEEVMAGDLSVVPRNLDRAAALAYPAGETGLGPRTAEAFWLGLRSAFPSAAFRIDHRIGRMERNRPPRAAIRWSLYGRHDGWGRFDEPSGAYVYVMGMTHAEIGPRGITREWTLIDDAAIWTQIELSRG